MLKTLAYSSNYASGPLRAGVGLLPNRATSVEATPPSRAHAASHARTHDTNTKRNRNRFPDWGRLRRLFPPISDYENWEAGLN